MGLLKELPELVDAGILSEETAERIREHYRQKKKSARDRLPILFGILGALLAGLGVILIVAQNWNELSRTLRSVFAFLPLLLAQGLTLYVILMRSGQRLWQEASAVFLFFAIGACISLISQTYQVQGDLGSFMFTWAILAFPILYLLRSPTGSLLYLGALIYYTLADGYGYKASAEAPAYFALLLLLSLPFIYKLYKDKPDSNFTAFHNWVLPVVLMVGLGTFTQANAELILIGYFALFGIFLSFGQWDLHQRTQGWKNGFLAIGRIAPILLLLPMSFNDFWREVQEAGMAPASLFNSMEGAVSLALMVPAVWLLQDRWRRKGFWGVDPIELVPPLYFIFFLLGFYTIASLVLVNLLVVAIAGAKVYRGAKEGGMGMMNFGASILFIWILARFFATELSFLAKGLVFIGAGLLFFLLNLWMMRQKRRTHG